MKIKNVSVYGLEKSIIRSGYPMQAGEPEDLSMILQQQWNNSENHKNRAKKLAKTPVGSGHNNFLKGIIVQFDLKYPQYWTPQLQRYHWFEIISSQSKMHKLTSVRDIREHCNKYVLYSVVDEINRLIEDYNSFDFTNFQLNYIDNANDEYVINSKEELFQYIISNLPMGYEMWMGISTNYLQLKTIYNQRKNHKLEDWKEFCRFIESLPNSRDLLR